MGWSLKMNGSGDAVGVRGRKNLGEVALDAAKEQQGKPLQNLAQGQRHQDDGQQRLARHRAQRQPFDGQTQQRGQDKRQEDGQPTGADRLPPRTTR